MSILKAQNKNCNILNKDIIFNLERKKYLDEFITNEHFLALKDLGIVENSDLIGFMGKQYITTQKTKLINLVIQNYYRKPLKT